MSKLDGRWCCLTCNRSDLTFGAMLIVGGKHAHCPHCKSGYVHPLPGGLLVLDEYFGDIPPRLQ